MFIVKTTVRGFCYYLKQEDSGQFTWQGLKNNATVFDEQKQRLIHYYKNRKTPIQIIDIDNQTILTK